MDWLVLGLLLLLPLLALAVPRPRRHLAVCYSGGWGVRARPQLPLPMLALSSRQPNLDLEHAPARAAICSGHLHRRQGMLLLAPSRRPPLPRQRGMPAAEADGNSGLLVSNRTAAGAGTRPYPCAWVSSLNRTCLSTRCICKRDPARSRSRTSPHATRRGQARDPVCLKHLVVRSCQQND